MKIEIRPIIRRFLNDYFVRNWASNLEIQLKYRATQQACEYIEQHMAHLPYYANPIKMIDFATSRVEKNGLWMELGVYVGTTIRYIASKHKGLVHGFDSFEGLPDYWTPGFDKGHFDLGGKLPEVPDNVLLHKGLVCDTLPVFIKNRTQKIAFVHLDLDMYSGTADFFNICGHMIDSGTILLFDEYFGYPFWQNNEHRAFMEFIERTGHKFEYLAYGNAMVTVRIV